MSDVKVLIGSHHQARTWHRDHPEVRKVIPMMSRLSGYRLDAEDIVFSGNWRDFSERAPHFDEWVVTLRQRLDVGQELPEALIPALERGLEKRDSA